MNDGPDFSPQNMLRALQETEQEYLTALIAACETATEQEMMLLQREGCTTLLLAKQADALRSALLALPEAHLEALRDRLAGREEPLAQAMHELVLIHLPATYLMRHPEALS